MSLDSKHTEAHSSPNSTDSLYLLVTQVPRPCDMAIFVLTITTTTQPITLPLAHAHGVIEIERNQEHIRYKTMSMTGLLLVRASEHSRNFKKHNVCVPSVESISMVLPSLRFNTGIYHAGTCSYYTCMYTKLWNLGGTSKLAKINIIVISTFAPPPAPF